MLSIIASLLSCLPFQEPAAGARPPLPEGIVARVGERAITKQEYLDYLYTRFGKRAISEYVADLLVEEEAQRYGVVVGAEQVEAKVQEREAAAREAPRPTPFEEDLQRSGQSLDMFRETLRAEIRRDLLLDGLVRATRVVTDERLQQAFELKYGSGGVKLEVRHIVCMPNFLKAEKIRAGAKPNEVDVEATQAEARALAEQARQRLLGGEDFTLVCAQVSHDRVTRDKGGVIANYNGRLYGPAFLDAVMKLAPGGVSEVVETGAGFHVAQLISRQETKIEEVRAALVQEILDAEPTWQEKSALIQSLQGKADLQLW